MKRKLMTGSVLKNIIYFALPFFLSYFLQTLYGMADLFIIGQFNGIESTTAVSIGSQVMHMLTVMIVGIAMGATITIGRAIGGNKKKEASLTIGNTVTLFIVISIPLMIVLLCAVNPIVRMMSTPIEAIFGTVSYLTICFIGIPFITAYNIISSILRGIGDSKRPMYFIVIACITNIVLDYVFIGVMDLGVIGAALGTTLSQTLSVIVSLFIIFKQDIGLKVTLLDFKPNKRIMSSILKIGIPISLQDGFIQISFIIITIIANQRGLNDAAAVGIVEKIIGILFLVPSSMLSTVSALAAQNIGANQYKRATLTLKYGTMISVAWGIIAVITMFIAAQSFIGLFTVDQHVIILGNQYMRGYVWDCLFAGIHFCFSGYFCAYGLSLIPFGHNVLSILCIRIPLAFIASQIFTKSLFPMGLASSIGSLFSVSICIFVFIWLQKKEKETQKDNLEGIVEYEG